MGNLPQELCSGPWLFKAPLVPTVQLGTGGWLPVCSLCCCTMGLWSCCRASHCPLHPIRRQLPLRFTAAASSAMRLQCLLSHRKTAFQPSLVWFYGPKLKLYCFEIIQAIPLLPSYCSLKVFIGRTLIPTELFLSTPSIYHLGLPKPSDGRHRAPHGPAAPLASQGEQPP